MPCTKSSPRSRPQSKLRHRPDIGFSEEGHRYFVGETEYLSLTRSLRLGGVLDMNPAMVGTMALDRGTVCHEVLELEDKGELDEGSVEPSLVGYLRAWRSFRADVGWELLRDWVEEKAADDNLLVACRVDRVFVHHRSIMVLDIKTGVEQPWHAIQTAGQVVCLGVKTARRFSCYVKADGKYRLVEHKHKSDFVVFESAARVAWWQFMRGGKK